MDFYSVFLCKRPSKIAQLIIRKIIATKITITTIINITVHLVLKGSFFALTTDKVARV